MRKKRNMVLLKGFILSVIFLFSLCDTPFAGGEDTQKKDDGFEPSFDSPAGVQHHLEAAGKTSIERHFRVGKRKPGKGSPGKRGVKVSNRGLKGLKVSMLSTRFRFDSEAE